MVEKFMKFQRTNESEMMYWKEGTDITGVSVSEADQLAGSPKVGDMIARNPINHKDRWLVAKKYFQDNFKKVKQEGGPITYSGGTVIGACKLP